MGGKSMKRFELFEPTSLKEALDLLADWDGKAVILAGGTDLLVQWKEGKVAPGAIIALRRIPDLSYIRTEDNLLKIGAFTSHRMIEKSPVARSYFQALTDAVDNLGSIQIRNIATIGGNICSAAPSADTVPPLLVHGATLKIQGPKGVRILPLNDFFVGPRKTRLEASEILTEIMLPIPPWHSSSAYLKLTRRSSMELPLLGVASYVSFDEMETILEGRIALACAGPTCFTAKGAEELFPRKRIEEKFLNELGMAVLGEAKPRESFRCSAQYRREMIPVLVARTIRLCHERSFKNGG
jgi:carbon-monoxide dehydrogenase medium subunit